MSRSRLALITLMTALITAFSSSAAYAYPDPTFDVNGGSAADGEVEPGEDFTLFGDWGGTNCDPWTAEFEGQTETGSGQTWSVSFTAPEEEGTYTITFTCIWDDGQSASSSAASNSPEAATPALYTPADTAALPAVEQTSVFTFDIRVVADEDDDDDGDGDGDGDSDGDGDGDDNGALPDTGGPTQTVLLTGALLAAVGAVAIVVTRRRRLSS